MRKFKHKVTKSIKILDEVIHKEEIEKLEKSPFYKEMIYT